MFLQTGQAHANSTTCSTDIQLPVQNTTGETLSYTYVRIKDVWTLNFIL